MTLFRWGRGFRWTRAMPVQIRTRLNCPRTLQKALTTRDPSLARAYECYLSNTARELFRIINSHPQLTTMEISLLVRNLKQLTETVETRDGRRHFGNMLEHDLTSASRSKSQADLNPSSLAALQERLKSAMRELNRVIGDDKPVDPASPATPKLSEAMLEFLKERRLNVGTGTLDLRRSCLRAFMLIIGDRPIPEIGRRDLGYFKAVLQKLPARWESSYRGVPIAEVLARQDDGPRLQPATINHYLGTVHTFFEWAHAHGYAPYNPARKLKVRLKRSPREQRQKFSANDLKLIFEESLYFARSSHPTAIAARKIDPQTYHYIWVPLVALFSGLRVSEIVGLERQDIRREAGVWLIAVHANRFRRVKSASAQRNVPIHPMLLKMGFIEAIDRQGFEGHDWIWPGLQRGSKRVSAPFVNAWYHYRQKIDIGDPRKTFHSFRHNFIHALSEVENRFEIIAELAGHNVNSQFYGRFRKNTDIRYLFRVIKKIRFPVRLDHLIA